MYRIFLDDDLFYDPRIPDLSLTNLTCELEVNKTGTLKFTIPATHPKKDALKKMYSELSLYQDEDWLYSGRVLSDEVDFYGNRTVECEGELSYLLDSIQRYHEYHDISVKDYFTDLIAKHNADVDERKRFTVGQVTVVDNNDSLYRYTNYENTLTAIKEDLIENHNSKDFVTREGKIIKAEVKDPKVIFIIGNYKNEMPDVDNDINDKIKADTFERYRRDCRNIEIITYDELYERAYYIVNPVSIPF